MVYVFVSADEACCCTNDAPTYARNVPAIADTVHKLMSGLYKIF